MSALTVALGFGTNTASASAVQNWPRFRGPNGSGVSESRDLPVEFGPGKNLAWQTAVPAGHSSPVVWEDRVFLTGYEETQCIVVCLDLKSGKRLWDRTIVATRMERKSKPNDAASSTPAVDESGLYALFSGFGLAAFSHNGQERWRRPLDPFTPPHGMASSPVVTAGTVVVVADQVSDSYMAAFEAISGKSPVAADGKLYFVNESGQLAVLEAGRDWHVLAVNDLAENCYATPAIVDHVIVVRSEHYLLAFQNR